MCFHRNKHVVYILNDYVFTSNNEQFGIISKPRRRAPSGECEAKHVRTNEKLGRLGVNEAGHDYYCPGCGGGSLQRNITGIRRVISLDASKSRMRNERESGEHWWVRERGRGMSY